MSELATYTFHTDPGHGWLEVTLPQILDVGLEPSAFSPYSYHQQWGGQDIFYLEEDQDAAVFVRAYMEKYNKRPHTREIHNNSDHYIRKMSSASSY